MRKIDSCSQAYDDETVGQSLNDTVADDAVAETKDEYAEREEDHKCDGHEDTVNYVVRVAASGGHGSA